MITLIKELRSLTDAPMHDCKKALELTNGNIELAKEELKKMGVSSTRTTLPENGTIAYTLTEHGIFIAIGKCETDFVARNESFVNAVQQSAYSLSNNLQQDFIKSEFFSSVTGFKENCDVELITTITSQKIAPYLHHNRQRFAFVAYNDKDKAQDTPLHAQRVAIHVVSTNPKYISRANMPIHELEFLKNDLMDKARLSGKPEKSLEMIVAGQLKKKLSETVLMDQPFYADPKITVEKFCQDNGIEIEDFTNVMV